MSCCRQVDRSLRMRRNIPPPSRDRKHPESFCWALVMRRSCSTFANDSRSRLRSFLTVPTATGIPGDLFGKPMSLNRMPTRRLQFIPAWDSFMANLEVKCLTGGSGE